MEPYTADELSDAVLADVVEYLMSLRGGVETDAAMVKRGKVQWEDELDCNGCHELEAGADGDGAPVFAGRGTAEWVARVIRDASAKDLYGPKAEMPPFEAKLSDEQIKALGELIAGE